MKPTYEELEVELAKTQELLKKALEEIAKLKDQLNLNSKNSSKPPSTDQKGNTSSFPKKRKSRQGINRSPLPPERVDRHVECKQENCPHCGSKSIQQLDLSPEILQQVELPEVRAIVTEYLLLKYRCHACGNRSTANLPHGIPPSVFGPKLMGLMATLTGVFHLAKREAIQLIKDLYDVDIGLGSTSNIEERVALALDPIYQRIHHFVIESEFCKHFDETGWRDSGKRHFVWLASCKHAAFYMVALHRNTSAFQELIGSKDPSTLSAVTDRYAVYNQIGNQQYCLAHLIREFRRYAERDGPDERIGSALEKELIQTCQLHKKYCEGLIDHGQRNRLLGHRKRQMETSFYDGMANGSDDLYRLCEKLLDHFDKLWTFMKEPGMEPTNNLAERDLRKLVVWRKKSYGTRSARGKRFVERITTVAQTLKRQGRNILIFMQEAVTLYYGNDEAPLIIEELGF